MKNLGFYPTFYGLRPFLVTHSLLLFRQLRKNRLSMLAVLGNINQRRSVVVVGTTASAVAAFEKLARTVLPVTTGSRKFQGCWMVASLGRPEKGSSSNDRGSSSCCATSGPAQCLIKMVHRILNIIRCNPCLYEDLCALMTC